MLETTNKVLLALEPQAGSREATPSRPLKPASPPDQGPRQSRQPEQPFTKDSVTAELEEELESVPEVSPEEKMDLYQQMDAMLDSIRDGTFKTKDVASLSSSPAPEAPVIPTPSLAARPSLYTSDGPTEAPPAPTTNEYEKLLLAGELALISDPWIPLCGSAFSYANLGE